MNITPTRGHVYRMEAPEYGRLHCLAVVPQTIPGLEGSFLAVRVTVTSQRYDFPSWVRFNSGDPCAGYAVVLDLDRRYTDELAEDLGPLSAPTQLAVDQQLRRMFGL